LRVVPRIWVWSSSVFFMVFVSICTLVQTSEYFTPTSVPVHLIMDWTRLSLILWYWYWYFTTLAAQTYHLGWGVLLGHGNRILCIYSRVFAFSSIMILDIEFGVCCADWLGWSGMGLCFWFVVFCMCFVFCFIELCITY
jgi:hypothetical protein